jgi:hypothetical protein
MIKKIKFNSRVFLTGFYLVLRYYAAFTLLTYGFAKIMGAQFTVLDSQLAKPMGEVSGFWLTWYYFGYSPVYAAIVAWAQVGGAVLLCFRRTALLGAMLLLPVMVNVVAIDVWVIHWRFNESEALRNAAYVLIALVVVVGFHAKEIYEFWLRLGCKAEFFSRWRWLILAGQIVVVCGMIAYTTHQGYWLANVNNRAPTPIDGAWHVTRAQPEATDLPDWIYFEYNRAFMTVFHYQSGKSDFHDFRVNEKDHTLIISKRWLTPGSDIFKGTWERKGDTMTLTGSWANHAQTAMTLERTNMPVKDHE